MNSVIVNLAAFLVIGLMEAGFYFVERKSIVHRLVSFLAGSCFSILLTLTCIGVGNFEACGIPVLLITSVCFSLFYELIHVVAFHFQHKKDDVPVHVAPGIRLGVILMGIVSVTLLFEVAIFNYKAILTKNNEVNPAGYVIGAGLEHVEGSQYVVASTENCYIRFTNFSTEINSIKVEIDRKSSTGAPKPVTEVKFSATDEANINSFTLGSRDVLQGVASSQYAILHLAGVSNEVRVDFNADEGDYIFLNDVHLNPIVPLIVSYQRMFVVFLILLFIYVFLPGSPIYRISCLEQRKRQGLIVALFVLLESCMVIGLIKVNTETIDPAWENHKQYQALAHAFAEGNLYLEDEPPEALVQMGNPYDIGARRIAMRENGTSYLWDHVYFEGKYYVYYGVVPEILFYYPYYMLTHQDFKTAWGVAICMILFVIALTQLLRVIVIKWFPKVSFGIYLLLTAVVVNSTGLIYLISHPDFYGMPIAAGLMFAAWGMFFWISSLEEHNIRGGCLTAGSICMALTAGCRPQIVLLSFLVFPLFLEKTIKERVLFSKQTWKKTVAAIVPYLVVAAMLMYYNYARFHSPFDFGANYNLTTNDMTKRFPSLQLALMGLFVYYFQPCNVGLQFPFIKSVSMDFSYLGNNIYETMFGGLFFSNPILFLQWKLRDVKHTLKEKGVWYFVLLLMILPIVITVFDIVGAGILPRYLCDFSLLFFLAACFVIFAIEEKKFTETEAIQRKWHGWVLALSDCSMIYNFLMIFANTSTHLTGSCPELYYSICYGLQFWL